MDYFECGRCTVSNTACDWTEKETSEFPVTHHSLYPIVWYTSCKQTFVYSWATECLIEDGDPIPRQSIPSEGELMISTDGAGWWFDLKAEISTVQ